MQLSFGEQVKIVLKRQGITIKELASRIEEQTGKKMSRQNLTQRLGRDNFQEQDMFMVAQALGCSLTINLLDEEAPEELVRPAAVKAEPVAEPEEKVEAAPETPELDEEADFELDEFEEEELEEEELEEEELEVPEPAPTEAEKKESRFRTLNWRRRGDKQKEKAAAPAAEPPVEEPAQPEEPIEIEEPVMEEPIEIEETKSRDELMKELNADIAALGDSGPIILDDIPDRDSAIQVRSSWMIFRTVAGLRRIPKRRAPSRERKKHFSCCSAKIVMQSFPRNSFPQRASILIHSENISPIQSEHTPPVSATYRCTAVRRTPGRI